MITTAGGRSGDLLLALLAAEPIAVHAVAVAGATRGTYTLVGADGRRPGRGPRARRRPDRRRVRRPRRARSPSCRAAPAVVAICGSLPAGCAGGPARAPDRRRSRARRVHDPRLLDPGGARGRPSPRVPTSSPRTSPRPRAARPEPIPGPPTRARGDRGRDPRARRRRRLAQPRARAAACFADAEGCVRLSAPAPERVVNAVGCGDALIGGFAAGARRAGASRARRSPSAPPPRRDKLAHLHPGPRRARRRRGARAAGRADAGRRRRRRSMSGAQLRPARGRRAQPRRDRASASRSSPSTGRSSGWSDDGVLTVGSSGAIVACGAARLGMRTAYVGVVGDDAAGRFIARRARAPRRRRRRAAGVDPEQATGPQRRAQHAATTGRSSRRSGRCRA